MLALSLPVSVMAETGTASWYGRENKFGARGEKLQHSIPGAAHKKLPFGSRVKVTDLKTNRSVVVVIEDRGPYKKGRIIDLNYAAASQLGIISRGICKVKLEVLK